MNQQEISLLKQFLSSKKTDSLLDVRLVSGFQKIMLYPTNDLWLTEGQFKALKKFLNSIGETEFYLTQFDGGYVIQDGENFKVCDNVQGIFSETNVVYKLNLESSYSTYEDISLYSVSVLFSSKGTWAILIDETLNAGYGIFVSSKDYVDKLKSLLNAVKTEYKEWLDDLTYEKEKKFCKEQLKQNDLL